MTFQPLTFQPHRVIVTDLDGAFACLQRAARRMVAARNGGRLIAVTSVHEHQPRVGSAAYDAAKHGLGGLMKTLALELGRYDITANCVAPGEIATPMTGQEDEDRTAPTAPASRWAAPATPGKSPPSSSPSWPPRRRPTSPARAGRWTAACCRWARKPARTSPPTTGEPSDHPEPHAPRRYHRPFGLKRPLSTERTVVSRDPTSQPASPALRQRPGGPAPQRMPPSADTAPLEPRT